MQMDNVPKEIYEFKKEHKEQVSFESVNSVHKNKLLKNPTLTEKEFNKMQEMRHGLTTSHRIECWMEIFSVEQHVSLIICFVTTMP
jgi:hypothetical protein